MTSYPEGIQRMDDYIGAIVKLNRSVRTRGGVVLKKGTTYIVHGHWRGRLTLAYWDGKTLAGKGPIAMQGVHRNSVTIMAHRLA